MAANRQYYVLSAMQAGDAVACAIPLKPLADSLDSLGVPERIRWIFPVVKAAAAIGLLSVNRFPWLARLTTAMLTLYFVLAVGAHVRVHDSVVNTIPAAGFVALYATMTVKGPAAA